MNTFLLQISTFFDLTVDFDKTKLEHDKKVEEEIITKISIIYL